MQYILTGSWENALTNIFGGKCFEHMLRDLKIIIRLNI